MRAGRIKMDKLPKLQDMVDTRVAAKISQIQGVGLVTISGGQRPAVRIQANPTALANLGMSIDDLRTAIRCDDDLQHIFRGVRMQIGDKVKGVRKSLMCKYDQKLLAKKQEEARAARASGAAPPKKKKKAPTMGAAAAGKKAGR